MVVNGNRSILQSDRMAPTAKKPDELHRDKIRKRTVKTMILSGKPVGRLTDQQKKTPSQKKSESLTQRLNHRRSNQ